MSNTYDSRKNQNKIIPKTERKYSSVVDKE